MELKTDSINRALELRKTLESDGRIMVVDFSDTLQGKDTSRVIDLMPNVATGNYVFRAKVNVKSIDPVAASEYKVPFNDVRIMSEKQIEDLIKKQEFDFPLWFKRSADFSMRQAMDYNLPFITQVAGCNFHDGSATGGCWYCFVDDKSNDGRPNGKAFLAVPEHIDSMIAAREKIRQAYAELGHDVNIRVLRMSGGEPTIVLDYVLNLWREIAERGLDFVGQIDSNLSTGPLVDEFERQGIFEPHTLEKIAEVSGGRVKVLTAIKGISDANIADNVQSSATVETQKYSILKFLRAGFDIFPQMYNPNPAKLEAYLRNMDSLIENFSLRVHIGPLKVYGPNTQRLTNEAARLGIPAQDLIAKKKAEWDSNYTRSVEAMDAYLRTRYGVGYRETTRADIPLKILKK